MIFTQFFGQRLTILERGEKREKERESDRLVTISSSRCGGKGKKTRFPMKHRRALVPVSLRVTLTNFYFIFCRVLFLISLTSNASEWTHRRPRPFIRHRPEFMPSVVKMSFFDAINWTLRSRVVVGDIRIQLSTCSCRISGSIAPCTRYNSRAQERRHIPDIQMERLQRGPEYPWSAIMSAVILPRNRAIVLFFVPSCLKFLAKYSACSD